MSANQGRSRIPAANEVQIRGVRKEIIDSQLYELSRTSGEVVSTMSSRVKRKVRVVLADDHPGLRYGIRKILEKSSRIEVIGEANNGQEALQLVEVLEPDVLVLDIQMPVMNGVQVASHLKNNHLKVKILGLSAFDDLYFVKGLMENGASGYLTKDEAPKTIVEAVLGVAHGEEEWLSDSVREKLHSEN